MQQFVLKLLKEKWRIPEENILSRKEVSDQGRHLRSLVFHRRHAQRVPWCDDHSYATALYRNCTDLQQWPQQMITISVSFGFNTERM